MSYKAIDVWQPFFIKYFWDFIVLIMFRIVGIYNQNNWYSNAFDQSIFWCVFINCWAYYFGIVGVYRRDHFLKRFTMRANNLLDITDKLALWRSGLFVVRNSWCIKASRLKWIGIVGVTQNWYFNGRLIMTVNNLLYIPGNAFGQPSIMKSRV